MSRFGAILVFGMVISTFAFNGSIRAQQVASPRRASASATPAAPPNLPPPPVPPGFVSPPPPPALHKVSSPPITNRYLTPAQAASLPKPTCCSGDGYAWAYQETAYPLGLPSGNYVYDGTNSVIDGQNDNPSGMPGSIYQWFGAFETGDNLFIQVGFTVVSQPNQGNI
jgi:hypothetical protein